MYAQVDPDGHSHAIFNCFIDFKKYNKATTKDDMLIITQIVQHRATQSTSGWYFLTRYKDGSEQWIPLKILKESNPSELAEFATVRGIAEEPAFTW